MHEFGSFYLSVAIVMLLYSTCGTFHAQEGYGRNYLNMNKIMISSTLNLLVIMINLINHCILEKGIAPSYKFITSQLDLSTFSMFEIILTSIRL